MRLIRLKINIRNYLINSAEMTERDRAAYIKMLQDTNTPYELEGNRLTFKERENAELMAMNENFENQRLDLIRTSAEEEWAIKKQCVHKILKHYSRL